MTANETNETKTRNERRVVYGKVVGDKSDKTIIVEVARQARHTKYGKYVRHTSRYHAHDEKNEARQGDTVEIAETRRLSKTKTWRLVRVVERAELVE